MRSILAALPFLLSAACSTRSSPIPSSEAAEARRPIVVELFSSEGCSSCPPADLVVRDLARLGNHGSAEIVAIEQHVDYWNYLGWADPFSTAASTERQRVYAKAMGYRGVYTPQVVIDGVAEMVGSDKEGILEAITNAAKRPKAQVRLVRDADTVRVTISDLPQPRIEADVLLTTTEEGLSTAVPRGENAGTTVIHAPIARSFEKLGVIATNETSFAAEKLLPKLNDAKKGKVRAIVIVQATEKKAIIGTASIPWI